MVRHKCLLGVSDVLGKLAANLLEYFLRNNHPFRPPLRARRTRAADKDVLDCTNLPTSPEKALLLSCGHFFYEFLRFWAILLDRRQQMDAGIRLSMESNGDFIRD